MGHSCDPPTEALYKKLSARSMFERSTTTRNIITANIIMLVLSSLVLGLAALPAVFAIPFNATEFEELGALSARTDSSTGTSGGYYYSFWTDGGGSVTYTNGDAGSYSVEWNNVNNFVGGKGWNPGSAQTITYSGDFTPQGNGYLSI